MDKELAKDVHDSSSARMLVPLHSILRMVIQSIHRLHKDNTAFVQHDRTKTAFKYLQLLRLSHLGRKNVSPQFTRLTANEIRNRLDELLLMYRIRSL
ncbi:Uncharacterised protein [BD1-7 clade bacterium]|uniref:Uncharacterized protein n=1 Tax=BD1-7 clade bacterium TaxID=2029982 RepID=A0A5S9PKN1_9GAMM|nr:Uncharacterised protein [BD1-7 clade bacterium]